nr:hypothetical protein [uncultured Pedobacter sp.]
MNIKKRILGLLIICSGLSCGTLGGIGPTFYFPTSKVKLEEAFSRMYIDNPGYDIPDSLKKYDDWSKRGYNFLQSRVLYFDTPPKELYYMTYIGDSTDLLDTTKIGIAIRAVCIPEKSSKWLLGEELNDAEKNRMTARFNTEIISRLEEYTKSKAFKE